MTAVIATVSQYPSQELAERGWRDDTVSYPDGTTVEIQVPLTEEEFLHPKEGYYLPNSTFHDGVVYDARGMLTSRYESNPNVAVFSDLIVEWDIDLKDHCPDICVVFGVENKERNRTAFNVAAEGARPIFIIEVVSPRYRKLDRETKVLHYARAGVQEYVIVDRRKYRQQILDEVLGYRLVSGFYQPISPDDDNRILCETVGLSIGLQDGRLVMEDAQTGERLLTSLEQKQRADQERQRADQEQQRADQERQRADQERQRADQVEALLEQERQEKAFLIERLRAAGINPEEV